MQKTANIYKEYAANMTDKIRHRIRHIKTEINTINSSHRYQ